jgi:hypothetical protein
MMKESCVAKNESRSDVPDEMLGGWEKDGREQETSFRRFAEDKRYLKVRRSRNEEE